MSDLHVGFDRGYYVLGGVDGHEVIPYEGSLFAWADMYESSRGHHDRWRVAYDELGMGYRVSTRFFGMDLVGRSVPPLVFETMAFSPLLDPEVSALLPGLVIREQAVAQLRYATWDEAVAGHAAVLAELRAVVAG